jgi:hypothetical protein
MSVGIKAIYYSLLTGTLVLGAGCAGAPSLPSSGHGQSGGAAGGAAPSASSPSAGKAAPNDPAKPDPRGAAGTGSAGGGTPSAQASGPDGPGQTSDERRAALDKELNDSLGSFDAELRTEQQRVAQERDARRASAGTAATEGESSDKGADSAGSASTEVPQGDADKAGGTHRRGDASKRRDTSGDLKSEKASRKPDDNAGNGATAREIPDGSDDDVVARRLRQAAEQETDPELKEKLWQEYIDYKRNAQGK